MTRRAPPRPGVDRMVSTSWSGRRWSSPAARQGRALARGLEGRFPLQHHYVSDQNSSSSRCWAYFSLALKHGIYRDSQFFELQPCENRKLVLYRRDSQKTKARLARRGWRQGQGRGEKNSYLEIAVTH